MDKTKYWENRVNRLIRARIKELDRIFAQATQEAARIGASINLKSDKPFSFDDYPQTKKIIDDLMGDVRSEMEKTVVYAIDGAWKIANDKEDEFCNTVFAGRELTKAQKLRYFDHADKAREAFAARKTAGLNLSDRVWRYTEQFKQEIEMGLDIGISEGKSAADMARDLKQYLQQPDKLFRRVRDKRGNLQLSKNAAAYHPGVGVYRSSYKNALRLTRTETNMAYRTADHMRYQNLDFVVGIEIHTSNNHPIADICDELKGKYPKDFKFVGWHPQCRCYVTSVLKTEEEMIADTNRRLAGENVSGESVNEVRDVPQGFKDWMKDNQERIEQAEKRGTLPYFITDNKNVANRLLHSKDDTVAISDISNDLNTLRKTFDVNIDHEEYLTQGIASKFDFIGVQKQINGVLAKHNIKPDNWETSIGKDLFDIYCGGEGLTLWRTFANTNDGLEVRHQLFKLAEEYQNKGISKEVFRIFYQQYKNMGVRTISVHANIDVGGYTWARYGFMAVDKDEALKAVSYCDKYWKTASEFIDTYYKKHSLPASAPFPMRLLTEQSWGKEVLLGTDWAGKIDLFDQESVKIFEHYLGM